MEVASFALGLWDPLLGEVYAMAGADPSLPGGYLDQIPPSPRNPVPLPPRTQRIRPTAASGPRNPA